MRFSNTGWKLMAAGLAGTILFGLFLKLPSFLGAGNRLAEAGWPLLPIILVMVIERMLCGALVVLIVLPRLLRWRGLWGTFAGPRHGLRKAVLLGVYAFTAFALLATVISLGLGIFKGDLASVFAVPDIAPDPDVIGLGYFLLALVPAIWEELAFRGLLQTRLRGVFSQNVTILLSSLFFGLYHLSNLLVQPVGVALPGVVMAFFFGLGWAYLTARSGSLIPAMVAHYMVDSLGQIFLGVDTSDPMRLTGFFLLLTVLYPVVIVLLAKRLDREKTDEKITHVPIRIR